jgi:NADH dehydrogenase
MAKNLHKILVIGGGAGGLELITALGHTPKLLSQCCLTLLDGRPTHIWKPLLHEVATGAFNSGEDEVNYFPHG